MLRLFEIDLEGLDQQKACLLTKQKYHFFQNDTLTFGLKDKRNVKSHIISHIK